MRIFVALYVLSTVAITATNQAAVNRKLPRHEDSDLYSDPWIPVFENAPTEAWGVGPEDIYNSDKWNNRRKGLKHILDDVYEKVRDTDWRYRNEHLAAGQTDNINDGSRVLHFGTTEGKWELRAHDKVERTLGKPLHERGENLPYPTKTFGTTEGKWEPRAHDNVEGILRKPVDDRYENLPYPTKNSETTEGKWELINQDNVGRTLRKPVHEGDENLPYPTKNSETTEGKWELRNHDSIERTLRKPVHERDKNLPYPTKNLGTTEGKWDLINHDNVERTLRKTVHERDENLPYPTENWSPKTNIRTVDENDKLHSSDGRKLSENRDSTSWTVDGKRKLHFPDEAKIYEDRGRISGNVSRKTDRNDRLWPQNNEDGKRKLHLPDETKMYENQDSILGKVSHKINPNDRSWPQNNDEKHSTVKPREVRDEDPWPDKGSFTQKNNDYWYITDEHPGVAFVLPGIILAGQHRGLLGGEWLRNTATAEMGAALPWERTEKSVKVTSERPEDFKSKWDVYRTTEKILIPDPLHHGKR